MNKRFRKVISLLLICVFLQGSYVRSSYGFSVGEEREIGEKLLYSIRTTFDIIDDPDVIQYLYELGRSVERVAGVKTFNYHYFIIDNKNFNAFAAPSGLIFFYSGLISAMHSEDEFVSVLAHEIGHIVKRHLASRVKSGTYSSLASLALAVAAIAFGGTVTPVLLTGAIATGQSMNLHYNRQNEQEADLLAFTWLKRLGRSPKGQVGMLETMRRIARYRSDKLPQYLLTHPNPEERLDAIEARLDIESSSIDIQQSERKEFEFFRFKYRILSLVKHTTVFKAQLQLILSRENTSDFNRYMAKYGLSQIKFQEKNYEDAQKLLKEVINFFPEEEILLADLGAVQIGAGKLDDAEITLQQALKKNSSDMYATYLLASLYFNSSQFDKALKYYKIVSYHLVEYSQVYFNLGKIYTEKNNHSLASFYLGKYQLYEGNLETAESILKKSSKDMKLSVPIRNEAERLYEKIKKITD